MTAIGRLSVLGLLLGTTCVACSSTDSGQEGGSGGSVTTSSGGTAGTEVAVCAPEDVCVPAGDPCADCLVDDLEDGDGLLPETAGRVGQWYGYVNGGTIEPVGAPVLPEELTEPREGSQWAMHVSGVVEGVALLGIDLERDGDSYGTYDASAYQGISFWAKNDLADAQPLEIRVSQRETVNPNFAGTCSASCDPAAINIVLGTSGWVPITIPWNALRDGNAPFSPEALINVQVLPREGAFDFWIDDVSFF